MSFDAWFTFTCGQAAPEVSRIPIVVVGVYLSLLVGLGIITARLFKGTSSDYFVVGRSIGPVLLLMSVFGTTMTGFAMVGSTAKAFDQGIGVYGLMASASGLVHALVFFLVGIRLWAIGKRYNYVTQIEFFRDRFESPALGYLLFPILVALVIPYLLVGVIGASATVAGMSRGMFPVMFEATAGAIPRWLTGLVICTIVLFYIFFGGLRGAAWANAFQTIIFLIAGVLAAVMITDALGGAQAATQAVLEKSPRHLAREGMITPLEFASYMFVPLSVGMFPHLFQHWLTARSAKSFRLTLVCHPIFIMIVWVPCILMGIWATGVDGILLPGMKSNAVLGRMVGTLVESPFLLGIVTAGVLAAIMSSLDSQFVCLGTMFTTDVVLRAAGPDRFTDKQKLLIGRGFVVLIVVITYILSLYPPPHLFDLGVWCFTGFSGLFPLVFCALYWKRTTRLGAIACVLVTTVVWFILFNRDILSRQPGQEGESLVLGLMPVAIVVTASALTIILVSLVTKPLKGDTVEKFFPPRASA